MNTPSSFWAFVILLLTVNWMQEVSQPDEEANQKTEKSAFLASDDEHEQKSYEVIAKDTVTVEDLSTFFLPWAGKICSQM